MLKLLFICTHNRCRSILSEAIFNHIGQGHFEVYSAGSQPVGAVHPLSIQYLAEKGIETSDLKSQSWEAFDSLNPDAVITVCDSAAGESCPLWMGNSLKVHWGLPDPSKLTGSEEDIKQAFLAVMNTIEVRAKGLLASEEDLKDPEILKAVLTQLSSLSGDQ